jgi:hypothetical protein
MISAFLRWLGTPFRAARAAVPFSHDGRQTLVYLVFAGCGPVLTLVVWWAMRQAGGAAQWSIFGQLANIVAGALLIVVIGLAMFVSIRAIKIGRDGLEASGDPDPGSAQVTTTTTTNVSGPQGSGQ